MTNLRDLGLWVQASPKVLHCGFNKYLILCLVLIQPDLRINEVLNIIIIVWVRGGGGVPLNVDVWVILGSHLGSG